MTTIITLNSELLFGWLKFKSYIQTAQKLDPLVEFNEKHHRNLLVCACVVLVPADFATAGFLPTQEPSLTYPA